MSNYNKGNLAITFILIFVLTSFSDRKPNILIIGDSISMGYTPYVEEYFIGTAYIKHNEDNAQHTGNGLKRINEWLGNKEWDIVQFNFGLWDLCYRHPDSKIQGNRDKINGNITYSLEEYSSNLDSLVTILKLNTKAKLIFVTTTYVPKNDAGRFEIDAVKYNDAAKKIMRKHSIKVNDIYEQSIIIHEKYGKGSNDVHYTNEGYQKLGNLVIDFLINEIQTLKSK